MSEASSSPSFARRAASTTRAPASTNRRAAAFPIPELPPVTSTTFPSSDVMLVYLSKALRGHAGQANERIFRCYTEAWSHWHRGHSCCFGARYGFAARTAGEGRYSAVGFGSASTVPCVGSVWNEERRVTRSARTCST